MAQEDGTTQSKSVKMSPGWEPKALGGPVTIVGMFEAIDAIVLGIDIEEFKKVRSLPARTHSVLPAAWHRFVRLS